MPRPPDLMIFPETQIIGGSTIRSRSICFPDNFDWDDLAEAENSITSASACYAYLLRLLIMSHGVKRNTSQFSAWMVTAFDQLDMFDPTKWSSFRYCCYQHEICPSTNREHIQAYVMFSKRVTLAFLKKLDPTAHIDRDWETISK